MAYPGATEHVGGIVEMVSGLIARGAAYKVNDSVYFEVAKAARWSPTIVVSRPPHQPSPRSVRPGSRYGRLARLDSEGMVDGASEGDGELFRGDKRGPRDFALWKACKVRSPQGKRATQCWRWNISDNAATFASSHHTISPS